ncbi:MAG: hypothetical protein KGZ25_12730, partial [Planctomycetes bacterium]|nr:hypothetical protein [Planctomycetota bacterium]
LRQVGAGESRRIRSSMPPKSSRGTATAAIWNTIPLAQRRQGPFCVIDYMIWAEIDTGQGKNDKAGQMRTKAAGAGRRSTRATQMGEGAGGRQWLNSSTFTAGRTIPCASVSTGRTCRVLRRMARNNTLVEFTDTGEKHGSAGLPDVYIFWPAPDGTGCNGIGV